MDGRPRRQQRAPVAPVGAVNQRHVRRRQRIGQQTDPDTPRRKPGEPRNARPAGHEIGGDQPHLGLGGAVGTPAVLAAVGVVIVAQLAFTFAPFMQALFHTAPLTFLEGAIILGSGGVVMAVLEIEKALMRRFGFLDNPEA